MKLRQISIFFVAAVGVAFGTSLRSASAGGSDIWAGSLEDASKKAAAEKKIVLALFFTETYRPALLMRDVVMTDPDVKAWLGPFVPVTIDAQA